MLVSFAASQARENVWLRPKQLDNSEFKSLINMSEYNYLKNLQLDGL